MKKQRKLSDLSEKELLIRILIEIKKPSKDWYSLTEAADYLGITPSYLYKLNHTNDIAYYKNGKLVRYKKSDLDRYIRNGRIATRDELMKKSDDPYSK